MNRIDTVKLILNQTLQLGDQIEAFDQTTPLLGNIPELDSVSIVSILNGIEGHFDIEILDDDITAEVFESVGTLAEFIEQKLEEQ